MRVFVAGATGVIGRRLLPLLVQSGHRVAGLTRSEERADLIRAAGAAAVVADVYDVDRLTSAMAAFAPTVLLHELTDLPDDHAALPRFRNANARIRTEGTANLLAAADQCPVEQVLAQSIAWRMPPGPGADAVAELERTILQRSGTVLRYGQFYGPGTFYPDTVPGEPRVQIDHAAERTVDALRQPGGVITIVDD